MTCLEVGFEEWQWVEELNVLSLEDVGLGKMSRIIHILLLCTSFIALIINAVGLGISTIIFVIEKIIK